MAPSVWNTLGYGIQIFFMSLMGKTITHEEVVLQKDVRRAMDLHGNAILRLAYSYLHNLQDAEDVLQDTLIQYLDKAPDFHDREHEKAWLLKTAANLSKNKIVYNQYRKTDELLEEISGNEEENLSFVWEAVKELPEKQREVIHLFYYEGYSGKEIAEIVGENEATVRTQLKRGRERLKEILKEEYDFE